MYQCAQHHVMAGILTAPQGKTDISHFEFWW